jgi:phage I-like protein
MSHKSAQRPVYLADGERVELAAAETEPKWQLLFPLGVTKHRADFPTGGITFSADMLGAMVSNWEAEKTERQVNYFHRGATNARDTTPTEQKVASGWIKGLKLSTKAGELGPKAGLYAQIGWTKRAREFIEADELRYLSPEFTLTRLSTRTGKEQGPTLLGAALLNDPFLTELPRVAASDSPQENSMAIDPAKLRKRLKLSETATDDEVNTALEKEEAAPEAPVQLAEMTETVTKLNARVQAVESENAALKLAERKGKVEAFVTRMVKEGRISPAIRENVVKMGEASGLEAISFFEKQTPVVSLTEKGIAGSTESDAGTEVDEAGKKFLALADDIHAKQGGTYQAAHQAAKAQLPKEYALYASRRPTPSKSTRGDA